MVIGQTIVFLWRTFYRRGQRCTYSKLVQNTDEKSPPGAIFPLDHQGSPPVYEEVVGEKDAEIA